MHVSAYGSWCNLTFLAHESSAVFKCMVPMKREAYRAWRKPASGEYRRDRWSWHETWQQHREIQTSLNVNNCCPTATGCDVSAQCVSAPQWLHMRPVNRRNPFTRTSSSVYTDKALVFVWSGQSVATCHALTTVAYASSGVPNGDFWN